MKKKRDYKEALKIMVENGCSIRELAAIVKIPKTTLHRKIPEEKKNVSEELWGKYLELLKGNSESKGEKGSNKRWKKVEERKQNEN